MEIGIGVEAPHEFDERGERRTVIAHRENQFSVQKNEIENAGIYRVGRAATPKRAQHNRPLNRLIFGLEVILLFLAVAIFAYANEAFLPYLHSNNLVVLVLQHREVLVSHPVIPAYLVDEVIASTDALFFDVLRVPALSCAASTTAIFAAVVFALLHVTSHSDRYTRTYPGTLHAIATVVIACSLLTIYASDPVDLKFQMHLEDTVKLMEYAEDSYNILSSEKNIMREIEKLLSCCGVYSFDEYIDVNIVRKYAIEGWFGWRLFGKSLEKDTSYVEFEKFMALNWKHHCLQNEGNYTCSVPLSCCSNSDLCEQKTVREFGDNEGVFELGCMDKVYSELRSLHIFKIITLALALLLNTSLAFLTGFPLVAERVVEGYNFNTTFDFLYDKMIVKEYLQREQAIANRKRDAMHLEIPLSSLAKKKVLPPKVNQKVLETKRSKAVNLFG